MLISGSLDITNVVQRVSRSSNILHFDWFLACNDGYEFKLYKNDSLFFVGRNAWQIMQNTPLKT